VDAMFIRHPPCSRTVELYFAPRPRFEPY
jgi:hypothetical protein